MNELYERLLAASKPLMAGERYSVARLAGPLTALRAVLELHHPDDIEPLSCVECSENNVDLFVDWPCETVRAIARALDVPIEGDQQ